MAVKNKQKYLGLPLETVIEVIAEKDGKIYKQEMTLKEANNINKKKGFSYKFFQKGFSCFKDVIFCFKLI